MRDAKSTARSHFRMPFAEPERPLGATSAIADKENDKETFPVGISRARTASKRALRHFNDLHEDSTAYKKPRGDGRIRPSTERSEVGWALVRDLFKA